MRILILGAGGVGAYFGARIHAAGGDVTFLVRPARAEHLRQHGLKVSSACGDLQITPKVITHEELELAGAFDAILLSCKAYDLDSAMTAIAPAVSERTVIVPLLNGVRHIDILAARFGRQRVLGGVALISASLAEDGGIRHLNTMHGMTVGAFADGPATSLNALSGVLAGAGFDFVRSDNIAQAMWDKIVFLTTLAGATCLMRASVGAIMSTPEGERYVNDLLDECAAIARAAGHALSETQLASSRAILTNRTSPLMASMLRDVEAGRPTEADHILGDMLAKAKAADVSAPCLGLAYAHLQAYERRRQG